MKSQRVVFINFLLTLFIVGLHAHIKPYMLKDAPLWYSHASRLLQDVFSCAVPTFFSISAYLLFRNYSIKDCKRKIISRIQSLVVPFLIFSVFSTTLFLVLKGIKNGFGNWDVQTFIRNVYYCKDDSPIWYLRALFYFVLCSPLLLFLFERVKAPILSLLLLAAVVVNYAFEVPYDTFVYWLPDILVFSYLGFRFPNVIYKESFFANGLTERKVKIYFGAIYIALLILVHNVDEYDFWYWIYRMVSPIFVFILLDNIKYPSMGVYALSFWVYLSHGIVNVLVRQLYDVSSFGVIGTALIPLSVFVVSFGSGFLVRKFFPRFFRVANGAR